MQFDQRVKWQRMYAYGSLLMWVQKISIEANDKQEMKKKMNWNQQHAKHKFNSKQLLCFTWKLQLSKLDLLDLHTIYFFFIRNSMAPSLFRSFIHSFSLHLYSYSLYVCFTVCTTCPYGFCHLYFIYVKFIKKKWFSRSQYPSLI